MSNRAKESYEAFINEASKRGFPVQFLKKVASSYTFEETGNDEANRTYPVLHKIKFTSHTIDIIGNFSKIDKEVDAGNILDTVFHESAHAYISLVEDSPAYRNFVSQGKSYFKNAPLKNGSTTSDSSALFNEAVGEYVGNRISTWWKAYSDIITVTSAASNGKPKNDKKLQEVLQKLAPDYDAGMSQRQFGYIEKSHWFSANELLWTTKPLSEDMKQFIDTKILENTFPDSFSKVDTFKQLLKKSNIKLPEVPTPEQTKPNDDEQLPTPHEKILPKQGKRSSAGTLVQEHLEQQRTLTKQQHEQGKQQRDQMAKRQAELLDKQRKQLRTQQQEQIDRMRKIREEMDRQQKLREQLNDQQRERTEKERQAEARRDKERREREQREQRERAERDRLDRERRERELREQQERQRLVMRSRPLVPKPSAPSQWQPHQTGYSYTDLEGPMGIDSRTGKWDYPGMEITKRVSPFVTGQPFFGH